jgi:hypothetical protein
MDNMWILYCILMKHADGLAGRHGLTMSSGPQHIAERAYAVITGAYFSRTNVR